MKISNMGQTITIEAAKAYTVDELYQVLTEQGQFEVGKPELKKRMGFTNIEFPGAGGFVNQVSVSKQKITMGQQKASKGGLLKSFGIDAMTDGLGSLFNAEGRDNAAIMQAIAKEIERIVS